MDHYSKEANRLRTGGFDVKLSNVRAKDKHVTEEVSVTARVNVQEQEPALQWR